MSRLNSRSPRRRDRSNSCSLKLETLESRLALTGAWTAVSHLAPASIGTMELLSDGTVLAQGSYGNAGKTWYKLTPDATGSYTNGTWSQVASMNLERLYYSTNVLKDGRVLVVGGEFTGPNTALTDTNAAEIYDPVANTWSAAASFPEPTFGYGPSVLLADGRVLVGSHDTANTYIYDPATNNWSAGPTKLDGDRSNRESWALTPDGSILSYNIWNNANHTQRFDPATNSWIDSGTSPVSISDPSDPGAGISFLLPDGRVFEAHGTATSSAICTAVSTPGDTGSWAAGPVYANTGFGPGAVLPNGHVLLADGPTNATSFTEFAPVDGSLTSVVSPSSGVSSVGAYKTHMLVLPSGQVLLSYANSQLYVYAPDGSPDTFWKPTITSVTDSGDHFTLTGTQLNGISRGAASIANGMDTNYPIVQLNDGAGHVYYARTSNWSSTAVATGSTPVSTDFRIPANVPYRTYSLSVVANGIASDPVSFTGGTPSVNDMYAWDIAAATTTKGRNSTTSISVTVRRDSNTSGSADSNDALVQSATVTVELRNSSGTLIGTASGTTSKQGIFSGSFNNLANGTYVAEVTALTSSTYTWNKLLDPTPNDTDLDGDNLPDQQFTVGGAAAAMAFATSSTQGGTTATTVTAAESDLAVPANPPRLAPAGVDQSLLVAIDTAPHHARHATPDAVDEGTLDELFALT